MTEPKNYNAPGRRRNRGVILWAALRFPYKWHPAILQKIIRISSLLRLLPFFPIHTSQIYNKDFWNGPSAGQEDIRWSRGQARCVSCWRLSPVKAWHFIESVMLEFWLNEPKEIISATDVWSSERAIAQPRHSTVETTSRPTKNRSGGAARAA